MPIIARFYGMIIKMYFQQRDHNPPHFHVIYGEYMGIFNIQTLEMMEGDLPVRAASLVKEWAAIHKDEIQDIWNTQNFREIKPLD